MICQVCNARPVEFTIPVASQELHMCRGCAIDTAPAFTPRPPGQLERAGFRRASSPVAVLGRVRGARARLGLRNALAVLGV